MTMGNYWHPFADMAAVSKQGEFVLDRGEGAYVWDEEGKRYLDASGGLWYCTVGHGRAVLADAAAAQLRTLAAYSNFGDFATRPTLELSERLCSLAPVRESKVFFTSNGSDSVDTAVKFVRRYWQELGRPEKSLVVVRDSAYHGMHIGGTGLSGIAANRAGYDDLAGHVVRVPRDSAAALAEEIDRIGPERVAAFFCEPVIGAGGVFPPAEGYLSAARAACRERDVLFVADEVITGFGRVGEWFASTRWNLEPDLVLCAKGLTSGYVPMGAVIISPQAAEPFWREPGRVMWRHGYTYSGHATAAAVGLVNLDLLEKEGLLEHARELEGVLAAELGSLTDHGLVNEVRAGTGVLAAIELDPVPQKDPSFQPRVIAALRSEGVATRFLAGGALQVSPPLVIDESDVRFLAEAVRNALDAVA